MASGSQPLEYRKVQGFLSKVRTENQAFEPSYNNIYILSDSKGKYLQREQPAVSELIDTSRVFFWHRGGRRTADGVQFLQSKLATGGFRRGRSVVLFWHVTCDLNNFQRPERWLLPKYDSPAELLESLKPSFQRLIDFHRQNTNIDIGVLETPPVFWSKWNRINGHPEWNTFTDKAMHEHVEIVNNYIRDDVNVALNYRSPKFILDCMETRKRRHSETSGHRISLTSVLFDDGVHPSKELSQKWFFQTIKSVCM